VIAFGKLHFLLLRVFIAPGLNVMRVERGDVLRVCVVLVFSQNVKLLRKRAPNLFVMSGIIQTLLQ
jgi:hypothetical protein